MNIEHILSDAIEREIEAYEFYQSVYERVDDESVREVFQQLAREERGHKESLEQLKHDPTMMMAIKPPSIDYKIAEATEIPALSINMKPADAIALAMKKEQYAVELYRALENSTTDPKVKAIFKNLTNMELGHKHRLENVFVDIGYPEVF